MIHLFNKTEYSPFLQLSELNTQLSQTNQLKYAASAQPTQKSTAFTQLIRRSEKKPQHFYSFNAGLKKTQLLRSFFKKAAEKPAFTQLLRRAAFNFGKGMSLSDYIGGRCLWKFNSMGGGAKIKVPSSPSRYFFQE